MEGVGYWIFLLILYSLSMMAKKRKQKQAWRDLEDQEGEKPSPAPKPEMPGFLQDIFQEIKSEMMEKEEPETHESFEEVYEEEPEVIQEDIPKPVYVAPSQTTDSSEHSIKWDHPNPPLKEDAENPLLAFVQNLQSPDNLKQAIILKEVLDKPRSLRRSIR